MVILPLGNILTIKVLIYFSAAGELCQMQIGQKMVKVQKIIMPKAAVEDMQKKGYLEMKVRPIQNHRSPKS